MQEQQVAETTYEPVHNAVIFGLAGAFICWALNLHPNFLTDFISFGTGSLTGTLLVGWAMQRGKK